MSVKNFIIFFIILFNSGAINCQTLKVNPSKSTVKWKGSKNIAGHNGTITINKGFIVIKNGKISGGEIELNMKGITVLDTEEEAQNEIIFNDINDDKFFNVAKFPTATFEIIGYDNEILKGNLTIIGITKPIQFKVTFSKSGKKILANTVPFYLDLQKWGLKFSRWFGGIALEKVLIFQVHIETI